MLGLSDRFWMTLRPGHTDDVMQRAMQRLGNHCCQLWCSHTQRAAVGVNSLSDDSGFQVIALPTAHATCVGGALRYIEESRFVQKLPIESRIRIWRM